MPSSHAAAPGNVACEGGLILEFTDPVLKLCHVLMMLLAGGQPRVVQSRATPPGLAPSRGYQFT